MVKRGVESMWNIHNDRVMMALAMTMSDKPMAVNMSFQREYAEPYEWMKQQFIDLAFTFLTSVIFYEDYDMTPDQRLLMRGRNDSLWRYCTNLPDCTVVQVDDYLGSPLPYAWDSDDVQLYADRQRKPG